MKDETAPFKWKRTTGSTESSSTGPGADHTTGSSAGTYCYVDASGQDDGDYARLLSSVQTVGEWLNLYFLAIGHFWFEEKVFLYRKKL